MTPAEYKPEPIIRRNAADYPLRWKVIVVVVLSIVDYAFVVALEVWTGSALRHALIAARPIMATVGTAVLIGIIYLVMNTGTTSNQKSKRVA